MAEQFFTSAMIEPMDFLAQGQGDQSPQGELQFLTFPLAEDTSAMLPVTQLAEVLNLTAAQVTPIPDLAAWVLGIYNWRGEILWIVDLSQLLGLPSLYQQTNRASTYKVIVGQAQSSAQQLPAYLGLAVKEVDDMHWCNSSDIASAPSAAVTPGLTPFLRGYTLGNQGEMPMALDATAIFERLSPRS